MGAFAGEDVDFLALMSAANRKRLLLLESGLVRTFWTVQYVSLSWCGLLSSSSQHVRLLTRVSISTYTSGPGRKSDA